MVGVLGDPDIESCCPRLKHASYLGPMVIASIGRILCIKVKDDDSIQIS